MNQETETYFFDLLFVESMHRSYRDRYNKARRKLQFKLALFCFKRMRFYGKLLSDLYDANDQVTNLINQINTTYAGPIITHS